MSERIQASNLVINPFVVTDPSSTLYKELMIKVPFPPQINPRDLITLLPDGNVPTRTPNAFIIYRKALIEAARAEGHHLQMSSISTIASKHWSKEPEYVKSEYKRLALEAFNYSNTIIKLSCGSRRRKNERWNTITFNNNSMTSHKDSKKPKKLSKNLKIQSSPKSIHKSNLKSENLTNNIMNDNINDKHVLTSLTNNDNIIDNMNINMNNTTNNIFSPNNENMLMGDWAKFYPSPEISSTEIISPILNNDCFLDMNSSHLNVMLSPTTPLDQNFQYPFVNSQPILSEVPQQSTWLIGDDVNNASYYCDTNLTCQPDKNVNDELSLGFPEYPYIVDTGKLCLDTLKSYNIAI